MIVKVLEDEFFPSDLIVLKSTDAQGGLYIETKNLDGETNLKAKSVQRKMNERTKLYKSESQWQDFKGEITCELPNNAIYKFEGFIEVEDN